MQDRVFSQDKNLLMGKDVTIAFEYGSRPRKMHCSVLGYQESLDGERYVVFETEDNCIYHIQCDKIIYYLTEYEGKSPEEGSLTSLEEELLAVETNGMYNEDRLQMSVLATKEPSSRIAEMDTSHAKPPYEAVNRICERTEYDHSGYCNELAEFINKNFQGVFLTLFTTSSDTISGEVVFQYDHCIVLKSDEKTCYVNPSQIVYFF